MKVYLKAILLSICIVSLLVILLHNNFYLVVWDELKQGLCESDRIVKVHRKDGSVQQIPLEEYLEGVVGAEMSASFEIEALKAQAVAARTFVLYRNLEVDDSVNSQVYLDEQQRKNIYKDQYAYYQGRIHQAIQATKGEIVTYEHKPILCVFYATSCGKSANVEEYWNQPLPYLRSVDSSWDQNANGYEHSVMISNQQLQLSLNLASPIQQISQPTYYESGYVKEIVIDGVSFSGRSVREALGLRSSCFKVEKVEGQYRFTCYGYGHGIGMSQNGAQYLALQKKSYKDILHHYYQNVNIEKIE